MEKMVDPIKKIQMDRFVLECNDIELSTVFIPSFTVTQGELVRIEFHDLLNYDKLLDLFIENKKCIQIKENLKIEKIGHKEWRKGNLKYFSYFTTVKSYLTKNTFLSQEGILKFLNSIECPPNRRIYSLDNITGRLIILRTLVEKEKVILMGTAGIHLKGLYLLYKIVNAHIKNGGTFIEITYPPFEIPYHLDVEFHLKPKLIHPLSSPSM